MTSAEITVYIVSGISVVGAVASAAFSFRRNVAGISNDVISTYRERVKQLEERVTTCEGLHRANLEEMGKMKGAMATMEGVLKDRNPETTQFMDYLTKVAKRSEEYMTAYGAVPGVLEEIKKFMAEMTQKLSPPPKKKRLR